MMRCRCGPGWRVETFNLTTGQVNGLLDPVSFEVQTILNEPGAGKFTCLVRDTTMRQAWPGLQGIGVLHDDRPVWAGYVEAVRAAAGGAFDIGAESLDGYWGRRVLEADVNYVGVSQTEIGAGLANLTGPGGIVLDAQAGPSTVTRDRHYPGADHPYIGELIGNLTLVDGGPDYEVLWDRTGGVWSATAAFRDVVGVTWRAPVRADLVADDYGVDVDGDQLANRVTVLSGDPPVSAVASDTTGGYPVFDEVIKLNNVTSPAVLAEHADGYLSANRLPFATPKVTLPGDRGMLFSPGDVLERVVIRHGVGLCFDGPARILAITTKANADAPDRRELILTPTVDAEDALLDQDCPPGCPTC